jgi:ferredoxin-NADP reductase
VPEGWPRPPGRLDAALLTAAGWPADLRPAAFVCGPTGFVEAVADLLVAQGNDPSRVKTERFGPTGG